MYKKRIVCATWLFAVLSWLHQKGCSFRGGRGRCPVPITTAAGCVGGVGRGGGQNRCVKLSGDECVCVTCESPYKERKHDKTTPYFLLLREEKRGRGRVLFGCLRCWGGGWKEVGGGGGAESTESGVSKVRGGKRERIVAGVVGGGTSRGQKHRKRRGEREREKREIKKALGGAQEGGGVGEKEQGDTESVVAYGSWFS